MFVSILASSSKGNATYIESKKEKILVDAGLSAKKIQNALGKIGRSMNDVNHLFVTHEHSDHVRGVGVLARRYPNLLIYANLKTMQVMATKVGEIPADQLIDFEPGQTISIGDIDVESFGVSHDAILPQFYQFHCDNKSFAILTDTGYVSDKIKYQIRNADMFLFESNHDLEMLRMGLYPWPLKQRILSDRGHLSNDESGEALADLIGLETKKIFLGHLSPENNMKPLARITVENILIDDGFAVNHDFEILDTDPENPTDLLEV
ncbi:MBL fold metallo-hydrolase [Xylocopilactobacillus apicola]|uniref:Metallo-hydrolase n=1 Tax=Xylocopilactobacillus apicola TaxID=2932184 RepID=A0AAU9DX58_9LACO|nr:MBL fold metallo-hydrolase [Xylocopilactobacillus apicola]BDR58683.1 metallo-hydrolase [Xylocopilactobacillus apicola]